jgi:hypothetical protein
MCIFFSPNLQLLLPTFSILSVTLVKLVLQTKKKKEMNTAESNSKNQEIIYGEPFFSEFSIFRRKQPKQQWTSYEMTLLIASWTGILIFMVSLLLYFFE